MVEFTHHKIYKVKKFAKYQNIKTKENVEIRSVVESKDIIVELKNKEDKTEKSLENQLCEEKHVNTQDKVFEYIEKISKTEIIVSKTMNSEILQIEKVQNNCKSTTNSHENIKYNYSEDILCIAVQHFEKRKSLKRQTKIGMGIRK